jgi:pyridoxal 5'-phosphate synthase pdxT subunit
MIGVLAIQGDFAAHTAALRRVGVNCCEVRTRDDLNAVDGLIIPGGESTTLLKFTEQDGLGETIVEFAHQGKPILGTCAGAILLANTVYNPMQPSLDLIDITVERNGYGRQVDSFIDTLDSSLEGEPLEGVFIRAPRVTRVGPSVKVIASLKGEPVFVQQKYVLAATFHPELTDDDRVHRFFCELSERVSKMEPAAI